MIDRKYKYDVAFSFLQKDEELAIKISDLLKGRFETFIYSKKQFELVGKDGEKIFNSVFGKHSRMVVILYRDDWGKTKWTRIEMTAIRNRAYENGYDFTIFFPLDKNSHLPKWLPKTQIWYNYSRWGLNGIIPIIEYKIQQEGGIEKKDTVVDKAERISREMEAAKKKESFLNSVDGVKAANNEVQTLFKKIEDLLKDIEQKSKNIKIDFDKNSGSSRVITLLYKGYSLHVEWYYKAINSLINSYLYVNLWKIPPIIEVEGKKQNILKDEFKFDISLSNDYGWIRNDKFYLTTKMAEFCVELILNTIR